MRNKNRSVSLAVLFVAVCTVASSADEPTQLTVYWIKTSAEVPETEPPATQPPEAGGGGWTKAGATGTIKVTLATNEMVWIACRNTEQPAYKKSWHVKITGLGSTLKKRKAWAWYADGSKKEMPLRFGWYRATKQPLWEVLGLKRTRTGTATYQLTVTAKSKCCQMRDKEASTDLNIKMFVGADGAMARDIAITELALFPVDVPVYAEPEFPPTLVGPPGTGTWTYQFAYVDPDGAPRPNGGVWWSTNGPGIAAAEIFEMGLIMIDYRDNCYVLFTYDDEVDAWDSDTLCIVTEPIPTVSQWGIAIMALLLLIGGKVYFSRRRAMQA